ncbi:MAG TPA: hypothetical protein VGC84_16900, partial [Ilumatobacteraceae bacterium]
RGHGRTVLFVSHNLDAVKQLCPRSIWMDNGRVRADGRTGDVIDEYLEQHVATASAGSWIDLGDATRIGTGEVRFEYVRFDGPDDPEGAPRPGGRLAIDVVANASRRVKIGSLAIRVSIPGGPVLVGADPVIDADIPLELDVGTHRLRIEIESLALGPGSYTVSMWLARGGSGRAWSVFDSIENATHLEVEADPGARPSRGQAVVPCKATLMQID